MALAAVLTLNGVVVSGGSKAKGASLNGGVKPDADRVARYIAEHPGCRAEDIANALGTGTAELRPAMMKLKSLGAVEPKGKARATRYCATATTWMKQCLGQAVGPRSIPVLALSPHLVSSPPGRAADHVGI